MYCRQKTDYDDDCLPKFDGIPEAAGCRVYGDCDTFIREILKNVIGDERLKSWEGDRPQRIVSYEKNRCQMGISLVHYLISNILAHLNCKKKQLFL